MAERFPDVILSAYEELVVRRAIDAEMKRVKIELDGWRAIQPSFMGIQQLEKKFDALEMLYTMFLECEEIKLTDVQRKNADGTERTTSISMH